MFIFAQNCIGKAEVLEHYVLMVAMLVGVSAGFSQTALAQDDQPEITIISATFGEDRGRANCVAQVRQRVANRKLITTVSTPGLGLRNPRGAYRRDLRITYSIDGIRKDVIFNNGQKINLYEAILAHSRNGAANIVIDNAIFGEGAGRVNCTFEVRERFADLDRITTISTPGLGLTNPTGALRSQLRIAYTADGKSAQITFKNDEEVNLYEAILAKAKVELGIGEAITAADSELKLILEAPIARMCAGDSGRILICHLPEKDQLVFVDLVKAEIIHTMEQPDNVCFAAGREHFFIGLPSSNQLQRWSLKTFEREALEFMDRDDPPKFFLMGSDSNGPLAMYGKEMVWLWDPNSLKRISFPEDTLLRCDDHYDYQVGVSADGQTFCGKLNGSTGQPFEILRIRGNTLEKSKTNGHNMNQSWAMPSADGGFLLSHTGNEDQAYSYSLRSLSVPDFGNETLFPTADPAYFIAAKPEGKAGTVASICTFPDFQRVVTVSGLPTIGNDSVHGLNGRIHHEPLLRLLPNEDRLICVSRDNRTIVSRKLNLEEALQAKNKPFLLVNSKPSSVLNSGESFAYQISALSSAETEYKLEAGPDQMTVSPEGVVNWQAPYEKGEFNVVISASNSDGVSATHAFSLLVKNNVEVVMIGDTKNEDTISPDEFATQIQDNLKATRTTLRFKQRIQKIVWGGAGRYLIVKNADHDHLRVIDTSTRRVSVELELDPSDLFCATQDGLFIYSVRNRRIKRWSLESGEFEAQNRLTLRTPPTQLVAGSAGQGPLAMWVSDQIKLIDAESLRFIDTPEDHQELAGRVTDIGMNVSADGKTLCAYLHSGADTPILARFQNDNYSESRTSFPFPWAKPSADGTMLFTQLAVYETSSGSKLIGAGNSDMYVPSFNSALAAHVENVSRDESVIHFVAGINFNRIDGEVRVPHIGTFPLIEETRVSLVPKDNLVIAIPASDDQIIFESFDFEKAISGDDLFIASLPPNQAFVNQEFQYQFEVWSKTPAKYELAASPEGMTIDQNGLLKWTPTPDVVDEPVTVEIVVTNNGGGSAQQDFELSVEVPNDPDQ